MPDLHSYSYSYFYLITSIQKQTRCVMSKQLPSTSPNTSLLLLEYYYFAVTILLHAFSDSRLYYFGLWRANVKEE